MNKGCEIYKVRSVCNRKVRRRSAAWKERKDGFSNIDKSR